MTSLAHVAQRRKVLGEAIKYRSNFELWEESCVPSYCHPNWLAAFISWQRLYTAAKLARTMRPGATRVAFGW